MTRQTTLMVAHKLILTMMVAVAVFTVVHMVYAVYYLYRNEQLDCEVGTLHSRIACRDQSDVYLDKSIGHDFYFLPGGPLLMLLGLVDYEIGHARLRRMRCAV